MESESYSSDSNSESGNSESSSESEDERIEAVRILGNSFELPQDLCEDSSVFKEFFSLKTWNTLEDTQKEYLKQFLPNFPINDGQEKEKTVEALLGRQNFKFSSPLMNFHNDLKQGNYRRDIAKMKQLLQKAQKKQIKRKMRSYYSNLMVDIVIERERVLAAVRGAPPGPLPRLPTLKSHKRKASPYIRAKLRYFQELSAIRSEVGDMDQLSDDDNYPEDMNNGITNKKNRKLFTPMQRDMMLGSLQQLCNSETLKPILATHKARRYRRENHPDLNTNGITLDDIKQRVGIGIKHKKPDKLDSKLKRRYRKNIQPKRPLEVKPQIKLEDSEIKIKSEVKSDSDGSYIDPTGSPTHAKRIKSLDVGEIKQEVIDIPQSVQHVPTLEPKLEIKEEPVIKTEPDVGTLPSATVNPDELKTIGRFTNFFSLVRSLFPSWQAHRAPTVQLKRRLLHSLSQQRSAHALYKVPASSDWCVELESALLFLSGERGPHPDDFVPYVQYITETESYQWIGAGRDCDAHLEKLCDRWLKSKVQQTQALQQQTEQAHQAQTKVCQQAQVKTVQQSQQSKPTPQVKTPKPKEKKPPAVPKSTPRKSNKEVAEFRVSEKTRFSSAHLPYRYSTKYGSVVVPPLVWGSLWGSIELGVGCDALARGSPSGSTIQELLQLYKMSQFVKKSTDANHTTTLLKILEQLSNANNDSPIAKYDIKTKQWIYLLQDKNESDYITQQPKSSPIENENENMEVDCVEEVIDNNIESDSDVDVEYMTPPLLHKQHGNEVVLPQEQTIEPPTQHEEDFEIMDDESSISPTEEFVVQSQPRQEYVQPQKLIQQPQLVVASQFTQSGQASPRQKLLKLPQQVVQTVPHGTVPSGGQTQTFLQQAHIGQSQGERQLIQGQVVQHSQAGQFLHGIQAQSMQAASSPASQQGQNSLAQQKLLKTLQPLILQTSIQPQVLQMSTSNQQLMQSLSPKTGQIQQKISQSQSPSPSQKKTVTQLTLKTPIQSQKILQKVKTTQVIHSSKAGRSSPATQLIVSSMAGQKALQTSISGQPLLISSIAGQKIQQTGAGSQQITAQLIHTSSGPQFLQTLQMPHVVQSSQTQGQNYNKSQQSMAGSQQITAQLIQTSSGAQILQTVQLPHVVHSSQSQVQTSKSQATRSLLIRSPSIQQTNSTVTSTSNNILPNTPGRRSTLRVVGSGKSLISPRALIQQGGNQSVVKKHVPTALTTTTSSASVLVASSQHEHTRGRVNPLTQVSTQKRTVQLTGQSVQLASGQTVQIAGQSVQLPSGQTVQLASGQSVQLGQNVQLPSGQTVQLGQNVQLASGQSLQLGQSVQLASGQTVQLGQNVLTGQSVQLSSGQNIQLSGQSVQLANGQTVQLASGQNVQLARTFTSQPSTVNVVTEKGSQPIVAKLLTNSQGQVITVDGGRTLQLASNVRRGNQGTSKPIVQSSGMVRVGGVVARVGGKPLLLAGKNILLQQSSDKSQQGGSQQTIVLGNVGGTQLVRSASSSGGSTTQPLLKLQQVSSLQHVKLSSGIKLQQSGSGSNMLALASPQLKLVGSPGHILARILPSSSQQQQKQQQQTNTGSNIVVTTQ